MHHAASLIRLLAGLMDLITPARADILRSRSRVCLWGGLMWSGLTPQLGQPCIMSLEPDTPGIARIVCTVALAS